jgi:hypothetical protein
MVRASDFAMLAGGPFAGAKGDNGAMAQLHDCATVVAAIRLPRLVGGRRAERGRSYSTQGMGCLEFAI